MSTISDERLAETKLERVLSRIESVAAKSGVPLADDEPVHITLDVAELRRATTALTELQSLRAQGGVRALEWAKAVWSSSDTDYEHIVEIWKAFGAGHIQGWVEEQKDGKFYSNGEQFDTLAEAKAYVQAKHAQTILSSIEASPAPVSEEMAENKRLREAIEYYEIGVCAVGVPHEEERKVLHDCVREARALAAKGGQ